MLMASGGGTGSGTGTGGTGTGTAGTATLVRTLTDLLIPLSPIRICHSLHSPEMIPDNLQMNFGVR